MLSNVKGEAMGNLVKAVFLESLYQKRFKGVLTRQEMCQFLLHGPFWKAFDKVIDHE